MADLGHGDDENVPAGRGAAGAVPGVVVADVPWARAGAKCTYRLVCVAGQAKALNALTVSLQLSWRTVAAIIARVVADLTGQLDQLEGLTRIGIDEIACRKSCESTVY